MDDPLDMRDELETESLIDLEPSFSADAGQEEHRVDDLEIRSLPLFANREEEPDADESAETPVDLLMKSGQPRLSLVHGDDEPEDDGGLIDLAPADPIPADADDGADTWPWLADIESDDEAPLLKGLEVQFDADLAAPTACGARPTSVDVSRRPMPSLPPRGEIASVAQRIGSQFAGEVRTSRTPDVPALLTSLPKTFTPAAPARITADRLSAASPVAPVTPDAPAVSMSATPSIPTPLASIAMAPVNPAAPAIISEIPAARVTPSPSVPASPRKSPDTPKRIGDGKLVQSRLTWKPGDPFADPARSAGMPGRFRWELMLSTACGTAVFGLAFFWIMRMVF